MEIKFTKGLNEEAKYIREEVFIKEQGFHDEFDAIDEVAYHVVLLMDNTPVGTGRTFLQGDSYVIGRIAILKEMRKHHLGKEIMIALENKIKELGGSKITLSAQVQASGFYKKLGYTCIGEEYLDEHCPHIKMIKGIYI